jgi:DNA-directed RNA polymerase subunit beta
MQSLALDINVLSEGGGEVEVREEDDELLRAAEELGIDLSPGSLRATSREAGAQELEEGQDRIDADGELALPADEALAETDEDNVPGLTDDASPGYIDDDEGAGELEEFELPGDLEELEVEE